MPDPNPPAPNANPPAPAGDGAPAGGQAPPASQAQPPAPKPTYDLKAPEGSPLTADQVKAAAALAQKLGLSSEHAQALLVENSNAIAAQRSAEAKQMAEQDAAWQKQIAGDAELGGPKLAATLAAAKRGFEAAPKEVQDMLTEGGLRNFPGWVKHFAEYGRLLGEDTIGGKPGGGQTTDARSMYPSMPNA